ncbi:hypothetical protein CW304_18780 [Bacillus sp. UFRGS-B20]|nr:hypothetical protein CW304_18780 [Bacillus sp. UFRGS-B20]
MVVSRNDFSFCLLIDDVVGIGLRMIAFLCRTKDELMELPDGTAKDLRVHLLDESIETRYRIATRTRTYQLCATDSTWYFRLTPSQTCWRKVKTAYG